MYFYISKKNLLKKCPKVTEKELAILCELKEIDIDEPAYHWVQDNFYASYRGNVCRNDDGKVLSEYIEELNAEAD